MFCALCGIYNTKQSNDLKVWNSTVNVRCRTETIRQHFQSKSSIHIQAVEIDSQKKKSYFVKGTQKQEELKDTVHEKVFQALYWLAKEEIANTKITSLLQLLEKAGVSEIKYFQTRSELVLREMLIILSSTSVEGLTKGIKNSKCFGLLTDEVTDISNMQQVVTFIKFFDMEKGDTSTVFVDSSDLLEQSEEGFPNANGILNCLVKMLDRLGLARFVPSKSFFIRWCLSNDRKFREINDCKTMINVNCICHRLALACSDKRDELQFVKYFELTMTQLWKFFKDSPKRIKLYIRVAMQSKNFDAMPKRQKTKGSPSCRESL